MKELRRKVLLPVLQLSELTTNSDPRAIKRVIPQGKGHAAFTYYYRHVSIDDDVGSRLNYNLFPVVLDRKSVPWSLGTLYLLAQLEGQTAPAMTTYQSKADDLGSYKEWLDTHPDSGKLVFRFPKITQARITYRYRGYLERLIQAREIAPTTAKRRMGTVIAFYRWLMNNNYFQPEYQPWEETKTLLTFRTAEGVSVSKTIVSTDVSISTPKSEDPVEGTIQDGGKLRPLTGKEQDWILEATRTKGNTECYLIQLFMLATGARIQTACTLRLRQFTNLNPHYAKALTGSGEVFKLSTGPGTGIDTKNDKNGVLQVPRPVYELFRTYALSERVKVRRARFTAKHGESTDPYLFLTQQGSPYYTSRVEALLFNPNLNRRHEKTGQPVRQFLKEHVIPFVREHHDTQFHYRLHDLRASFGMNMTELLMDLVQKKKITLARARMVVKELLWHESFATTDLYLNYPSQMGDIYAAINGWGKQLQEWTEQGRNMTASKALDE